jgi:hypothetical protein
MRCEVGMRKRRPLRPGFVVTFGAAAAVATACGGTIVDPFSEPPISRNPPGPQQGDSGPTEGGGGCPAEPPLVGTSCTVTTEAPVMDCAYFVACGNEIFECSRDQVTSGWTLFMPLPKPTCPASIPVSGDPCPCFDPGTSCEYPASDCNGQKQTEEAVCQSGGFWQTEIATCNPPPVDGGPPDAGGD